MQDCCSEIRLAKSLWAFPFSHCKFMDYFYWVMHERFRCCCSHCILSLISGAGTQQKDGGFQKGHCFPSRMQTKGCMSLWRKVFLDYIWLKECVKTAWKWTSEAQILTLVLESWLRSHPKTCYTVLQSYVFWGVVAFLVAPAFLFYFHSLNWQGY